jgi:hypothetical protein
MRNLRWVTLDDNEFPEFPPQLCRLQRLEVLSIGGNRLTALPGEVGAMRSLRKLHLARNSITKLPAQLRQLNKLELLEIDTSGLKFPPRDVAEQGTRAILDFLHKPMRDQVFISYSHEDKEWMEKLHKMLKPLVRKNSISVWADTTIRAGAKWKEEIERALEVAKVAVLLVSPDFLASEFIDKHELPPILDAAAKEGLVILWVYVSSCLHEETEINRYHAAHDILKPLDSLTPAEQGSVLVHVCRRIKTEANPP